MTLHPMEKPAIFHYYIFEEKRKIPFPMIKEIL